MWQQDFFSPGAIAGPTAMSTQNPYFSTMNRGGCQNIFCPNHQKSNATTPQGGNGFDNFFQKKSENKPASRTPQQSPMIPSNLCPPKEVTDVIMREKMKYISQFGSLPNQGKFIGNNSQTVTCPLDFANFGKPTQPTNKQEPMASFMRQSSCLSNNQNTFNMFDLGNATPSNPPLNHQASIDRDQPRAGMTANENQGARNIMAGSGCTNSNIIFSGPTNYPALLR